MPIEIEGTTTVAWKQPGKYLGWPTICRRSSGELLIAVSGDRLGHLCPCGKSYLLRSGDDGATWSTPEQVVNTPLDDRDTGLIELADGTLLLTWFTSIAHKDRPGYKDRLTPEELAIAEKREAEITQDDINAWLGAWSIRSTDGGRTWDEPVPSIVTSPHGPVQLASGELLYVGRQFRPGAGQMQDQPGVVAAASGDGGQSWRDLSTIPVPDEMVRFIHEPHQVQRSDGTVVCLYRSHYPIADQPHNYPYLQYYQLQNESRDGGKSWTPLRQTMMFNHPPHVIELEDGRLLNVYSGRHQPHGELACVSVDGGQTWDMAREMLVSPAPDNDLGYPASVQLPGGDILTAYYQKERIDEKPCLMVTRWRLPF